jgi:hypothetical protein
MHPEERRKTAIRRETIRYALFFIYGKTEIYREPSLASRKLIDIIPVWDEVVINSHLVGLCPENLKFHACWK